MKQYKKLIADAVLALLLILLMNYSLTGGLVHEVLGIVCLVGFLVHAFLRRKYYSAMIKALRTGRCRGKHKASFVINLALLPITFLMLVSSLAISGSLFPGISTWFGTYRGWVIVHVACSILLLAGVFVHVCMHAKMFASVIRGLSANPKVMKAWNTGSKVAAVILALLVIEASVRSAAGVALSFAAEDRANALLKQASVGIINSSVGIETEEQPEDEAEDSAYDSEEAEKEMIDENETEADNESDAVIEEEYRDNDEDVYYIESGDEEEEQPTISDEPDPVQLSLEDYLGTLFCSGCGRHCCLLSPQCGKGQRRASEATEEYYSIYG